LLARGKIKLFQKARYRARAFRASRTIAGIERGRDYEIVKRPRLGGEGRNGGSSVPLRDKTSRKSVKTRDIDLPLRAEPRFHNADTIKLFGRARLSVLHLSLSFSLFGIADR